MPETHDPDTPVGVSSLSNQLSRAIHEHREEENATKDPDSTSHAGTKPPASQFLPKETPKRISVRNSYRGRMETSKEEPTYNDAAAIETLALHLVCTDLYHQVMSQDKPPVAVGAIDEGWLCGVDIPGKQDAFQGNTSWFSHYSNTGYESRVLARAAELFFPVSHMASKDWNYYQAPLSTFDSRSTSLRNDLFVYQEQRRKVLDVQIQCNGSYHHIVRANPSLVVGYEGDDEPLLQLEKLYLLQEAENEYRQRLSSTRFESATILMIDDLISGLPPTSLPILAFPGACQNGVAIRWIMSYNKFAPAEATELMLSRPWSHVEFFEETDKLPHPTMDFRSSKTSPGNQSSEKTCEQLDTLLTASLELLAKDIDRERFNRNFKSFLAINKRLPELKTQESFKKAAYHMEPSDLLQDNLFHVQSLKEILLQKLYPNHVSAQLESIEKAWARIMGIIALCFGCVPEPAFLLTAMDRLLDQLRYHMGFSFNQYTGTARGKIKIIKIEGEPARFRIGSKSVADMTSPPSNEPPTYEFKLVEDHESRIIFTELALFLRGSLIAAVDITKAFYTVPVKQPARFILESLLEWKPSCSECGLVIQLPDGELPTRSVAVDTKEMREGNEMVQSLISTDRKDVYDCFSRFMSAQSTACASAPVGQSWNHAFGPFFFYYADLYHPSCMDFR